LLLFVSDKNPIYLWTGLQIPTSALNLKYRL
jgi:hypothetical protein